MESSPVFPQAGSINEWLLVDAAAGGSRHAFFAIEWLPYLAVHTG